VNKKFSSLNLKIISTIPILILTSLIPDSFASSLNSTLDQQGNYLNPSLGIGFRVPEGWLAQESKKSEPGAPDIALVAPYSGGFTPSISFIVEKANGTSLDDFFQNKKSQILKDAQFQNVTFLSEQGTSINGYNAKILILKEDFTIQQKSIVVKFKEALVLSNNNFYTITYANEEKNFDTSLSNYDTLLNSITFVNQQNPPEKDYWLLLAGIGAAIAIGVMLVIKKKKKS
jgi:LPXTG-motif cell wall-anchored protein